MGVCHSANSKRKDIDIDSPRSPNNKQTFKQDSNVNKILYQHSNYKLNSKINQLNQHLSQQISLSPFNSMSTSQQEQFDADYFSSKYSSPYKFIKNNQNFSEMFKLLYQVCYLKCEPILGNITEEKKESDLLFFRIVLFYLTYNQSSILKYDTAEKMILSSFDQNQKKYKIDTLKYIIREIVELCIEILIYMLLLSYYLNEEELKPVLQNDMHLLRDKYMKVALDEFFFHQNAKYVKFNLENVKEMWYAFISEPINMEEEEKHDYKSSQIMLSDFKDVGLTTSHVQSYRDIDDILKDKLIYRIIHMFNAKNMFDVLITGYIPPYNTEINSLHNEI